MEKAKFGLIGLGVMGQNLALNIANKGYSVAVYNRTGSVTEVFMQGPAQDKPFIAAYSIAELVQKLEAPRRIMLMVKAGPAVDAVIDSIKPYLSPGDILIDGGNSFFTDTERRNIALTEAGLLFIGAGVSGGEEGALHGPSIMPGGNPEAWEEIKEIFTAAAARADDGEPCVAYIGPRGAGHYVKMVHNGIEYAIMQLMSEIYDLLHRGLAMEDEELAVLFNAWNQGKLSSYLMEITAEILKKKDPETGEPILSVILDEAQQKGTGKWTSQNALDLGVPTHTINAAVSSRIISGMKEQRLVTGAVFTGPQPQFGGNRQKFIDAAQDALYASIIISYAQGFGLMTAASDEYQYELDYKSIAKIWRAGCIIRADLLNDIMAAYDREPGLSNLLLDEAFSEIIMQGQAALRGVITSGIEMGIPVYALSASLAYFDALRTPRLPANLTQAQRDYFGAHTYRRVDKDGIFHTEWQE